ncbi:MAG TPA: DUF3617 domain-containing protein [Burkholderiales bacterium]|nr:DUF3617 domain-containing protein [Burkholderiales bacterium]
MNKTIAVTVASALLLAGTSALAQTRMRPGLWEHSFTMKSQSGEMERSMADMHKQLASMPPEQRKQVEQMMAQQGMSMGANGRSVRMCITKEQAERDEFPQQEGNCTQQVMQRTGNTIKVKFSCTGSPPTSGESEVTMASPTAYTGKSVVNTVVQGKPERMTMDQSGKWLAADCGNVKPMHPGGPQGRR